jgi:hypothetical protein
MPEDKDRGVVDTTKNTVRETTGALRGEGPWHSVNADVYHNNPNCQTCNSIEPENVRQGTGNKQLCEECQRLNSAGGPVGNLTNL